MTTTDSLAGAKKAGSRPRRWTRTEYHRAAEVGLFGPDERLELLDGEILQMPPQKASHFSAIDFGAEALERAFGSGFYVRRQGPLVLSDRSEPEPDLVVVVGSKRDYVGSHPVAAQARLVVEVSDTTLRLDRSRKAAAYARSGIADYWIVNLNARTLIVCRDPAPVVGGRSRLAYRSVTTHAETDVVSPLAAPQASVRVADLLPPGL